MAEESQAKSPGLAGQQTVGAGLTIVSTLAPTLGIPIPQWLRWVIFGIGVVMLLWPLIARAIHRLRQINVEPFHLIAIGLTGVLVFAALALSGVIWQSWRPAPTDPRMVELQTQVSDLQKQLSSRRPATTIPVTASTAVTPPKILTAPVDVAKKLAAIDALRDVLDSEMVPWINKGQQLTTGAWWNWAVGGEIPQLKGEVRKFYERGREINEKLERLQKDNVQFPDIHALASSPLGRAFLLKVEKFVTPVLALPDGPLTMEKELYRFLFEPYAKEAYEATNEVESWRRTTDQNALELRKQISQ